MITIRSKKTKKVYKVHCYRKPHPLNTMMYLIIDPDTGEVQEITADFYNRFIADNVEIVGGIIG